MRFSLFRAAITFASVSMFGACAIADQARVPSSGNGFELAAGQEGPIGGTAARRFMMVLDARAMQGIPLGSRLTGLRFRLDSFNGAAWPPANVTIADYELRLSAAATTAATMSSTYANNISGSQTLVKDGALGITAGAYPAGATPRAFGPLISFGTEFIYAGGPLCLDFSHTGTGSATTGFMDASNTPATDFLQGLYASNRTAVSGNLTSCPIVEFEYIAPTSNVVPASLAATEGPSNQEGSIGGTGIRRFQFNIDDAALNIPPGSVITGLAFRLNNTNAAWPPANITNSDYELRIGPGVETSAMSTTYASNFTSQTLVHDGALDFNQGVFAADASGATPEQFGLFIPFSTPYPYFGGPLSIDINYPATAFGISGAMDATLTGDFATSGMRGLYSNVSRTALTGSLTNAPVTRVFYTAGPGPDLASGVTKVYLTDDFASAPAGTLLNSLLQTTSRSLMIVSAADQLDTIGLGSQIVGHSARAHPIATLWPGAASSFTSYEVSLSRSVNPPSTISSTFAANIGADNVVARSGPLSIPVNSFLPLGSGPAAPFSFTVPYSSAYTYLGGPLSFFVRHSGGSQVPIFLDSISSNDPSYGTKIAAKLADSTVAPSGSTISATVIRLDVDAATNVPRGTAAPTSSFLGGLLATSDYTFQQIIAAEELRDIPVGSLIDHLWLRNYSTSSSTPASDSSTTDFEVALSTSTNRPALASTTFANNEGADRVLVYDGLLALPADSLPAGSTGKPGKLLSFKRAFVYRGGDLCLTMRHRGFTVDAGNIESPLANAALGRSLFTFSFDGATGSLLSGGTRVASLRLGYTPSVCTPNALATTEGDDGQQILGTNSAVQIIVAASELRSIDVGSAITGVSFRNSSTGFGASFPTSDFTFTRFDVRVAPTTVAPLSMSDTFASNVGAGEIAVREGPLAVPQDAFPASGSFSIPGEFAWFIAFDRAFIYPGGNLCITLRTQGLPPGNTFLDCNPSPTVQGAMRYANGSPDALSGPSTFGAFAMRFAFTARAFCPWDLNNDGLVTDDDFVIFLAAYNTLDCTDVTMPEGCPADFNYDRLVDDLDFQAFLMPYNDLVCP